jgi:DNA topoisomerase-1
MHTITLDEAIKLFDLPRTLGVSNGETVTVAVGRFGPFAKRGPTYASLGKEDDPYTITFEQAVALIDARELAIANRIIKKWDDAGIEVLNGRYGPYITDGSKNGKIPKDREPASLTLEECKAILEAAPEAKGRFAKKAAAKKAAVKKGPAKKAAATMPGDATAPAKKATATKAPAAKRVVGKNASVTKATSKPAAALKKSPGKPAAAKTRGAKQATGKTAAARKATTKTTAAKAPAARRAAGTTTAAQRAAKTGGKGTKA